MNAAAESNRLTDIQEKIKGLLGRTREFWLHAFAASSVDSMKTIKVSVFGRKGDTELPRLRETRGAIKLSHRGKDAAVVLDIELYKEFLEMRDAFKELTNLEKARALEEDGDTFDAILAQIQSPQNRESIDRVFALSDADINASYRPGKTESGN